MENKPWLWAKEEVKCKSKKLKKFQDEQQKIILLQWRRVCSWSNLLWLHATSNHQSSRGAPTADSKLWSGGIEQWSVVWNCYLGSCKLCFCNKLSSKESPGTLKDAFAYPLAYWTISWHLITQKCNIVSVQNFGAKKKKPTYNKCLK